MTIHELIEKMPARLLDGAGPDEQTISGGYACDMLSWVISRIGQEDCWLTIQNSPNVLAVASLSECACILLTEAVEMDSATLERAKEKQVVVLSTSLNTWQASARLSNLLNQQKQ